MAHKKYVLSQPRKKVYKTSTQPLIKIMAGQKKEPAGKQKTQAGFLVKMNGKDCAVFFL